MERTALWALLREISSNCRIIIFLFLGKVCVCGHDYCMDDACVCSDGGACSFVTSRVG